MDSTQRGLYFIHSKNGPEPIFAYEEVKDQLPIPITDREDLQKLYDFAIKKAFDNAHQPEKGSVLVANFQDSAFNQNLFLWDSSFISCFLSPFSAFLPGIKTLDNFYARQLPDGLIPREFSKITGDDYPKWINREGTALHSYFHRIYEYRGIDKTKIPDFYYPDLQRTPATVPYYTLDNLSHPELAYAEYRHYLHSGDVGRLLRVHEPLYRFFLAYHEHLRHRLDLYVTDWSSMDNSPRNKELLIGIDASAEMVLFADSLIRIYEILNLPESSSRNTFLREESAKTKARINERMWDSQSGFYYDLNQRLEQIKIKTIAGFWPLLAGVCDDSAARRLAEHLKDSKTFCRVHRVPSLAADESGFHSNGGYWAGGVWSPTNLMVTSGLERYGYHDLAKEIALNHLENVLAVFLKTGTIWETYPADEISKGDADKGNFVGWSGIPAILYFMEYHLGLKADASKPCLYWNLDELRTQLGCRNYRFMNVQADLLAICRPEGVEICIETDHPFDLELRWNGRIIAIHVEKAINCRFPEKE